MPPREYGDLISPTPIYCHTTTYAGDDKANLFLLATVPLFLSAEISLVSGLRGVSVGALTRLSGLRSSAQSNAELDAIFGTQTKKQVNIFSNGLVFIIETEEFGMSKYINKFWVTFTLILTVIMFIILFPLMVAKYGILGAILVSPLLILGMVLAYIRGYWVSRWMSEWQQKRNDRR